MKINRKTYPQLLPKIFFWAGLIALLALLPLVKARYGNTASTVLLYSLLLAVVVRVAFLIRSTTASKKRKKEQNSLR